MNSLHSVPHRYWDRTLKPIASVKDGDSLWVDIRDSSDGQLTPTSTDQHVSQLDFSRVNPMTGPIEVEGAEPGDVVEIEVLEFRHRGWGWTAIIPGFGLLSSGDGPLDLNGPAFKAWKVDGEVVRASFGKMKASVPLRPFLGVVGTAPREYGRLSVIPPRENGGNMDMRDVTVHSRVLLPVFTKGALVSMGDSHLAQGDGEVCGTAVEAPTEVKVLFRVRKDLSLEAPLIRGQRGGREYREFMAFLGISGDLMQATRIAVRRAVAFLSHLMSPAEAYMLSSAVLDLHISEVVDVPNWVVSAYLPLEYLSPDVRDLI